MWDTSKDYRLLIADKSIELFLRTLESGNFKGHWNKKMVVDTAHEMSREIKYLSYSYMEPEEMANSPQIKALVEKTEIIIQYLGGEDWKRKFLDQAQRKDKQKVEESIARVNFFLNTFSGLKNRILWGKINDPLMGIDIKVGEVMSVAKHTSDHDLLICNVNLGEKAVTVVTNDLKVKEKHQVAVSLLPPRTFKGITSEGMFLGDEQGILKNVKGLKGKMPQGISLEVLNESRNLVEGFLKK